MSVARVGSFVSSVFKEMSKFVKLPWKITGPVSSPEFLESLPVATDYRQFAPGTPPHRALIPGADADKVYNIKYYERDFRRANLARPVTEVDPSAVVSQPAGSTPEADHDPLSIVFRKKYVMGKLCRFEDAPGDGYQR